MNIFEILLIILRRNMSSTISTSTYPHYMQIVFDFNFWYACENLNSFDNVKV